MVQLTTITAIKFEKRHTNVFTMYSIKQISPEDEGKFLINPLLSLNINLLFLVYLTLPRLNIPVIVIVLELHVSLVLNLF